MMRWVYPCDPCDLWAAASDACDGSICIDLRYLRLFRVTLQSSIGYGHHLVGIGIGNGHGYGHGYGYGYRHGYGYGWLWYNTRP